jgi:nicotinamidase-related amidase
MAIEKLDPGTTASILIDLQNGIVNMPHEPRSDAEVIRTCRSLVAAFHQRGASVRTADWVQEAITR